MLSAAGGLMTPGTGTGVSTVPDAKAIAVRILRAASVYGIANLGIRALNFLLLPVYTRFLSPSDYGMIALAETLAAFFAAVSSLGFDASIQRLYFRHVDTGTMSSYLGSVLKFSLLLQSFLVALVLTVGHRLQHAIVPGTAVPFRYFALALITALALQFFNYRLVLYQAERRPGRYAALSFLSSAMTASLCVGLVVFARRGVMGMLGGKLISAAICFAVAVLLARPVFRTRFYWPLVRETIAVGAPLVPHLLMALGLVTADRFILAHYRDLREVGLYSVAYTFGMIMSLITMSLNQAWAPVYYDVARQADGGSHALGKMCSGLVIVLTAIACFGAFIAQSFVVHFLDSRYAAAGRIVPWIIGAYLAHSLFSIFSLASMQARRTGLIMGASFVGLVVNTVLNFALVPSWGMYGAAWATLIGYAIEAVVMYVLAQRSYRLQYDLSRTFAAMGVFAVMLAATQVRWNPTYRPAIMAVAAVLCFSLLLALGSSRILFLLRSARKIAP